MTHGGLAQRLGHVWLRRIFHSLLRLLFRMLLTVEIEGLEYVPRRGPALLLISHTNFLDGPMACVLTPRMVMPMGKHELFRVPIFGWLLRRYGGFPVRRGEMDLRALRSAFDVLAQGHVLLVAPEGTRSGDGHLQQGKPGTAYIAAHMNVPLVPMAVIGVEHFRRNLSQLRRTPVRIVLGPAFRLQTSGRLVPREVLRQMTDEIMYQMARLLPPERRGVYSDLSKATEAYIIYEPEQSELAVERVRHVPSAVGG
jgi:1-acyl-sn-glycerol-3-phosphate acyltransferase